MYDFLGACNSLFKQSAMNLVCSQQGTLGNIFFYFDFFQDHEFSTHTGFAMQ